MKVACFLGDSITLGNGGNGCFPYYVCTRLGWTQVNLGVGGTGYLNTAGGASFKFRDRISTVVAANPDIVIVEGGTNDTPALGFPLADFTTELPRFFNNLHAALPSALVYVMAPPAPFTGARILAQLQDNAAALKVTCAHLPWTTFINCGPSKWITGTGDRGTPNGTGNADVYINAGGHPSTIEGQPYLGALLSFAISPPSTGLDY
jgi:lysophospholipase L1-like esterase